MTDKQNKRPWYREPWPWLLMAGPAVVVVAGFATYYIAVTRGDTLVSDDYYKEGKNIELQLERDQAAVSRGIRAQVLISPQADQARVMISGDFNPDQPIRLLWIHPTQRQWDQTVTLSRDHSAPAADGTVLYTASFQALHPSHHWYVRVEDGGEQWRVQEKWLTSQGNSVTLQPIHQQMLPQKRS